MFETEQNMNYASTALNRYQVTWKAILSILAFADVLRTFLFLNISVTLHCCWTHPMKFARQQRFPTKCVSKSALAGVRALLKGKSTLWKRTHMFFCVWLRLDVWNSTSLTKLQNQSQECLDDVTERQNLVLFHWQRIGYWICGLYCRLNLRGYDSYLLALHWKRAHCEHYKSNCLVSTLHHCAN